MKIENRTPLQAPRPDQGKLGSTQPKESGPAFSAAFAKALATAPSVTPSTKPSVQAAAPITALAHPTVSAPVTESGISPEDHMEAIKFRMKTGYYNNNSVHDALSEKLSAIFDEQA